MSLIRNRIALNVVTGTKDVKLPAGGYGKQPIITKASICTAQKVNPKGKPVFENGKPVYEEVGQAVSRFTRETECNCTIEEVHAIAA